MKRLNRQKGFTIVELMIATGVFSIILLICMVVITQIGRMFYKGVTMAKTQEIARLVTDDISQTIQFGRGFITNPNGEIFTDAKDFWCVGRIRYSVQKNVQISSTSGYALARDVLGSNEPCKNDSAVGGKPIVSGQYEELLQKGMRVTKFSVSQIGSSGVYKVSIIIAFGDDDLLTYDQVAGVNDLSTVRCKGGFIGSQFCAVASLNTELNRRSSTQ